MDPHAQFRRFVDRCQVLIGSDESRSLSLAREIHQSAGDLPVSLQAPQEHVLRIIVARAVHRVACRDGLLPARSDLALSLAAFGAGVSFHADCQRLSECFAASHEEADVVASTSDWRVRCALGAMNTRFSDPALSLNDAAAAANVTMAHLTRLLRGHLGTTLTAYLRAMRVKAGARLLGVTRLSVKEIAVIVGYSSASRFNHNFRRIHGVSPTTYRRTIVNRQEISKHDKPFLLTRTD